MGTQTIPDRDDGLPNGVIDATWFNTLKQVLAGMVCGRNTVSGAPESGNDLGSNIYPWGRVFCDSMVVGGSLLDVSTLSGASHKVVSGKTRTTSNQPAFITPAGASGGAAFTVKGASTPLAFEVFGVSGQVSSDITVSGLATAPSSNNTCTLNDSTAAGQESTRTWGEPDSGFDLTVSSMGSNISALVGGYAAFKIVNGANTEYFLAAVESTTKLKAAFRGYFFNSTLAPVNRIKITNGNTITLMKLHWVFADVDGTTIATTATVPKVDATQPTGAATNDYWFDLVAKRWKRFDGSAFQTVDRTLIGMVVVDTADCVAARCIDFYAGYSSSLDLEVEYASGSTARSTKLGQRASVAGNIVSFQTSRALWDMATDLAGSSDLYSATEQANRVYYLYLKDTGQEVISDISPYYRGDLSGWYHPHNPWRSVGSIRNDAASNLSARTLVSLFTAASPSSDVAALTKEMANNVVRTWTQRPTPADIQWEAICWSPELRLFVATAFRATTASVMTSPNGSKWTMRTSTAAVQWHSIVWASGLGLFVAVATTGGNVMTSPDGVTWTSRTAASTLSWGGLTWSPELSLLVAVAGDASGQTVMTSPDGINWTSRTPASNDTWTSVCWAAELGLFVAVAAGAASNGVMTSPDGVTWTLRTAASPTLHWRSVIWAAELGLLFAVASDATSSDFMTSPDGINWTTRTPPSNEQWWRTAYSPELKVLVAAASAATTYQFATSFDGINWTPQVSPNVAINGITWSGELNTFLAVLNSGTGNRALMSAPSYIPSGV